MYQKYPGNIKSLAVANDGAANVVIDLVYWQITVKSDEVQLF